MGVGLEKEVGQETPEKEGVDSAEWSQWWKWKRREPPPLGRCLYCCETQMVERWRRESRLSREFVALESLCRLDTRPPDNSEAARPQRVSLPHGGRLPALLAVPEARTQAKRNHQQSWPS